MTQCVHSVLVRTLPVSFSAQRDDACRDDEAGPARPLLNLVMATSQLLSGTHGRWSVDNGGEYKVLLSDACTLTHLLCCAVLQMTRARAHMTRCVHSVFVRTLSSVVSFNALGDAACREGEAGSASPYVWEN